MSGWLNPVKNRLLIVGNTSADYHVGAMFLRSAKDLGIDVRTCNTNIETYAPSMSSIFGKLFFKVAGKRPIESWKFNRNLAEEIHKFRPQIIFVTGIFPLQNIVFEAVKQINAKIVNYLTDYPWNPFHYSARFLENLKCYDLICSTKSQILSELRSYGVNKAEFTPFAYDPFLHHVPQGHSPTERDKFNADIVFIGTGDRERLPYLNALSAIDNLDLRIYGGRWENIVVNKWKKSPPIFASELRLATFSAKIVLGIVRKRNLDQSTMRTFEIPACGGCGIYEDTQEHREILAGYPDYGFFSSPEDLADKCQWLLEHPIEREEMRKLGIQIIVNDSNTYTSRLKTILEMCNG